jgi:hypothetical protein
VSNCDFMIGYFDEVDVFIHKYVSLIGLLSCIKLLVLHVVYTILRLLAILLFKPVVGCASVGCSCLPI